MSFTSEILLSFLLQGISFLKEVVERSSLFYLSTQFSYPLFFSPLCSFHQVFFFSIWLEELSISLCVIFLDRDKLSRACLCVFVLFHSHFGRIVWWIKNLGLIVLFFFSFSIGNMLLLFHHFSKDSLENTAII